MIRRESAGERLPRIVELVARLRGRGPRQIAALAEELGISEAQLRADVHELMGRIYYRPGGWVEDIQIFLEGDTLEIPRASTFQRPPRLSAPETLCVMLSLRSAVAQSFHGGDPTRLETLLVAAQEYLAGTTWTQETLETLLAVDLSPDPVGIRQTLIRAARQRIPCTITYLKPGQPEAEARTIHPWRLVHASGAWHALAWCTLRNDLRQFRVDRMLDVVLEEGRFEIPEHFDPVRELPSLLLQQDERAVSVRIRYEASAAHWVREDARRRGFEWTDLADGRVEILHRVGDMAWLLHHVLSVAPYAEVVAPPDVRALVCEVAQKLAAGTTETPLAG
jgi:predicted DNA-binding transcriptional regulator YafY